MQQVYRAGGALEQSQSRACEYLQGYRTHQRFSHQSLSERSHEMNRHLFRFALSALLIASGVNPVWLYHQMPRLGSSSEVPFAGFALLQMLLKCFVSQYQRDAGAMLQVLPPPPSRKPVPVLFLIRLVSHTWHF